MTFLRTFPIHTMSPESVLPRQMSGNARYVCVVPPRLSSDAALRGTRYIILAAARSHRPFPPQTVCGYNEPYWRCEHAHCALSTDYRNDPISIPRTPIPFLPDWSGFPDLLVVVWYGAPRDSSISSIAQLATYFRPPGPIRCADISQHGSNTVSPATRFRQYVKTHPLSARTRNPADSWTSLASLVQCRSSRRTQESVATALTRSRPSFLVTTRPLSAPP